MIWLSRETRFALIPPAAVDSGQFKHGGQFKNSWAGWPASDLIAPQLRLQLVVAGVPDVRTGYLCNIKVIDDLFRNIVVNDLIPAATNPVSAEAMLDLAWQRSLALWPAAASSPNAFAATPTPQIQSLHLHQSPYLSYARHTEIASQHKVRTMSSTATNSPSPETTLTHQFEFSAAHRLHCDHLSDEENQVMFSKCNNPAGHGHNYVVEVSISQDISDQASRVGLDMIAETVKTLVIDKLDHKHLNVDIDYFATVNPTVENISAAIFDWLNGQFGSAKLQAVKVFETPKTWAECRRS